MRAGWLVAVALAGCAKAEAFECAGDQQCVDGPKAGVCEPSGFCSFPDGTCPEGKRYGEWAGEGLGGSCVEGGAPTTGDPACESPCGPCATCVAGACAPKGAGEACELECSDYVFGLGEDPGRTSCLAGAEAKAAGTCEAGGVCAPAEGACAAGAEIVGCEVACGRADHNCTPGTPVASVTVGSLCTTGEPTAGCKATCSEVMGGTLLEPRVCDMNGACVAQAAGDCGAYTCADTLDGCRTSCVKKTDCAQGFNCTMGTMVCE